MNKVILACGEGGKLTRELIEQNIIPFFDNDILRTLTDSAVLGSLGNGEIAFTTDSYIVSPLFFPGGDIGTLSISGTVNDLSVCGAKPIALSFAMIVEEGFEISDLKKIIESASNVAKKANVKIVAGDTKVLPKGKGDQIFINTSGIGVIEKNRKMDDKFIKDGDLIIVSGPIAKHGATIAALRHNLKSKELYSDCAPLNELIDTLFEKGIKPKSLHDPTRGGVATLLNEVARRTNLGILIEEEKIPVSSDVKGVCEILGLDPLYLASEGRFVGFFAPKEAEKAVEILNQNEFGKGASIIGMVTKKTSDLFPVVMKTALGSLRPIDELSGLQLPRIC
jgi:hydrogenase expression/formation protein HypE